MTTSHKDRLGHRHSIFQQPINWRVDIYPANTLHCWWCVTRKAMMTLIQEMSIKHTAHGACELTCQTSLPAQHRTLLWTVLLVNWVFRSLRHQLTVVGFLSACRFRACLFFSVVRVGFGCQFAWVFSRSNHVMKRISLNKIWLKKTSIVLVSKRISLKKNRYQRKTVADFIIRELLTFNIWSELCKPS